MRPRQGYADDTATIHTHQRRIITKLLNNPAAALVERIDFDGTAGAVFKLPAELICFRSGRRKMTEAQTRSGGCEPLYREAA
jgi:hypothetical protein